MSLTDRERDIVLATMRLWVVNEKTHCVPDYELFSSDCKLSSETMRIIRDLVQVRQSVIDNGKESNE